MKDGHPYKVRSKLIAAARTKLTDLHRGRNQIGTLALVLLIFSDYQRKAKN